MGGGKGRGEGRRAERALRFFISEDDVLRARRARGRNTVEEGETENVNPSYSAFSFPTAVGVVTRRVALIRSRASSVLPVATR